MSVVNRATVLSLCLGVTVGVFLSPYASFRPDARALNVSFDELSENPRKFTNKTIEINAAMRADGTRIAFFPLKSVNFTFSELGPPWIRSRDGRWGFRPDPPQMYREVTVRGFYKVERFDPPTLGYFETVDVIEIEKLIFEELPNSSKAEDGQSEPDPFGN